MEGKREGSRKAKREKGFRLRSAAGATEKITVRQSQWGIESARTAEGNVLSEIGRTLMNMAQAAMATYVTVRGLFVLPAREGT